MRYRKMTFFIYINSSNSFPFMLTKARTNIIDNSSHIITPYNKVAEQDRFELSEDGQALAFLAGRWFQPLTHCSICSGTAVGLEPITSVLETDILPIKLSPYMYCEGDSKLLTSPTFYPSLFYRIATDKTLGTILSF